MAINAVCVASLMTVVALARSCASLVGIQAAVVVAKSVPTSNTEIYKSRGFLPPGT